MPERTAINEQIARMLELMPRAQYVGYTATPFANVFVDPDDDLGIFPKDFLIGLPKPPGYMGLEDFLNPIEPDGTDAAEPSNERARPPPRGVGRRHRPPIRRTPRGN